MNCSHDSARAWKMPVRIWRNTSGGGELGESVKAACITLDIDSIQIFWNAAASSADFTKLSVLFIDVGQLMPRRESFQWRARHKSSYRSWSEASKVPPPWR